MASVEKAIVTSAPRPVGRLVLTLAPIAVLARGVAFLVPVAIAHLFGVSPVTDAFFYALAFPSFVMVIVANGFGTVATPAIARVQADAPGELPAFVGGTAIASALAATVVGLVALLALAPLLPAITSFAPSERVLTRQFVGELLPFMALVGAGVILRAACEVRGRFVPAALSPMFRGGTILAVLIALHGRLGPHALPAALVAGQLVEVAWYLAVLRHSGLVPRLVFALDPRLRAVLVDVWPILGGEVLVALNLVVDKGFAGLLAADSVSLLEYADRTRFIPQTFVESTLLAVAFATWSNQVAAGDRAGYARQLEQSLRWIAGWTAPPLAGLYIGRHLLVELLYVRGEFTPADAAASAEAFGWYVPGLWSMLLGALAMRAHVVEGRLKLVFALGIASVAANITLDALLLRPMGIDGLALASSLVWIVVPAGYLLALAPTLRPVARLDRWVAPIAIAAASAGVAVAVEIGWGPPREWLDARLWVAATTCVILLALAMVATRPPARGAETQ